VTRIAALAAVVVVASGCVGGLREPEPRPPYRPDRRDYAAFRAAFPEVLEPNYLPFMVQRVPQPGGRDDVLLFCRWPDDAMPIPVWVGAPEIPEALQDEFDPRDPAIYVAAVSAALDAWEDELEGLVRFRRVEKRRDARLSIVLRGEQAPEPDEDVRVLGMTPIVHACRVGDWYENADRLHVEFAVPALRIFVADRFGLLSASQVEWIARHEIGHALGMRGHSPIPADLMYEVARDRVSVRELSDQDVNSFVSLYRLPNGTVFGRVAPNDDGSRREPVPPSGPPMLAPAPHVDTGHGFSVRLPEGWLRVETAQGMVAVDGVTWDYMASFQIVVSRYDTIEDYLRRFGAYYLQRSRVLYYGVLVVNGRRSLQTLLATREGGYVEEVTFIETGDGRVVVVTADCRADHYAAFQPWFEASLATLEIWD
jgi:hypothetical protein